MRTTTNIYLFNLAVADILTLIIGIKSSLVMYEILKYSHTALPIELFLMYEQYPWVLGDVVCDLKTVLTETFINTSILTIVAFSGERYLAICHPLSTYAQKSAKKTRRTILLIWIISFLAAAPWAWFTKVGDIIDIKVIQYIDYQVNYLEWNGEVLPEASWCSIPFNESLDGTTQSSFYMIIFSTVFFFIIPFIVVCCFYSRYRFVLSNSPDQHNIC